MGTTPSKRVTVVCGEADPVTVVLLGTNVADSVDPTFACGDQFMVTLEEPVPAMGASDPVAITFRFWLYTVTVPCGDTVPTGAVTIAVSGAF